MKDCKGEKEIFTFFTEVAISPINQSMTLEEIIKKVSETGVSRGYWIFSFTHCDKFCLIETKDGSSLKLFVPDKNGTMVFLDIVEYDKAKESLLLLHLLKECAPDTFQIIKSFRAEDRQWKTVAAAEMGALGFD